METLWVLGWLGGVTLAVAWLVHQETPPIRENTGTPLAGQDELLALNRRQIELLEREKVIPHTALTADSRKGITRLSVQRTVNRVGGSSLVGAGVSTATLRCAGP